MHASLESQIACAAVDSIGFCIFGRFVTNPQIEFIADSFNAALGTELDGTFFHKIGREVLQMEEEFNVQAGFSAEDDDLPAFFYDEPLAPTQQTARFRGTEVHGIYGEMDKVGAQGIPEELGRV
jgi:aldehyde:ferredoxin oxidoreductase